MFFDELNLTAIIIGGLLYMIYGGIYYSITVGKKTAEIKQSKGPAKYIVSVIIAFISSFVIGMLIQVIGSDSLLGGVAVGAAIGVLITLLYLKNTLFGLIPIRSFAIAAGDHLVVFTLLGLVHGILN